MKKIAGTDHYFVTEDGRIFSKARGELTERKLTKDSSGYYRMNIVYPLEGSKRKLVHRLVASAFVENEEGLPYVNHKDGDKLNNHYENLEWCTSSYNQIHAYENNLKEIPRGVKNGRNRLSEEEVLEIYWCLYEGARNKDVREKFDIGAGTLFYIKNKTNWEYLLKDLPDIPFKPRAKRMSENTVRWICRELEDGLTAKQIVSKSTNPSVTVDRVWDIRARINYKHISEDYKW